MTAPRPSFWITTASLQRAGLLFFHAVLSGSFLVAYLSGDEDTYVMHQVAGYTALAALTARVAAGLIAPAGSPLRLPRPSRDAVIRWVGRLLRGDKSARTGRGPLFPWMAAILLVGLSLAAVTGAVSDVLPVIEHLHEAMAEATPWLVVGHIGIVLGLNALKPRPAPAGLVRA